MIQAAVGRNFDEIIRAVDALQLGDKYKIATPVNWQKGQDVIVNNAVSNEDAKTLFPDYKAVLVRLNPYQCSVCGLTHVPYVHVAIPQDDRRSQRLSGLRVSPFSLTIRNWILYVCSQWNLETLMMSAVPIWYLQLRARARAGYATGPLASGSAGEVHTEHMSS